jgi:hypothetical protein
MVSRLAFLFLLLAAWPSAWAETDVAGSRDPLGLERFPHSWIVDYRRDETVSARDFVVGRVERLRRDTRVQELLRVEGTLESAIYRIPEGTPVADVAAHYRSILEGGLLFRCAGRDCGRSNEWANQVFGKAILFGPDGNQQYLAWEWQGRLISVYVIERGNRRIYANVQVLVPADEGDLGANALFARRLTGQGWTVIEGIVPRVDGSLPGGVEQVFAGLGPQLAAVADAELYLVCHLYGAAPPGELVAATARCAEAAVEQLSAAVPGLQVRPFGAGPFLPRGANPVARLELVVPTLLAPAGGRPAAAASAGP